MTHSDMFSLPDKWYWKDRLTCKGCEFPLVPPVFYCYNASLLHPLCKNCSQCNVPTCKAKVGNQRSVTLEKILELVSFSCQFRCKKAPFQASDYKIHLNQCHLRPMHCIYCQKKVPFVNYVGHLQSDHNIKERPLDKETLILNFSEPQPRTQIVQFGADPFLICFDLGKLWVEYLGLDDSGEIDYHVRVAGVKYDIDFDMEVVGPRSGGEIMRSGTGQPGDLNRLGSKFIIPPKDEELFLLFIHEDDNDTISSIGSVTDMTEELIEAEKMSFAV